MTIVEDPAAGTAVCTAGCRVDLTWDEAGSLGIPFNKGFQLDCVIRGNDPGSNSDDAIHTFTPGKVFNNITQIFEVNQVFRKTLGTNALNEDVNGSDEVIAEFTLVNLTSGASVTKRSNQIERTFV